MISQSVPDDGQHQLWGDPEIGMLSLSLSLSPPCPCLPSISIALLCVLCTRAARANHLRALRSVVKQIHPNSADGNRHPNENLSLTLTEITVDHLAEYVLTPSHRSLRSGSLTTVIVCRIRNFRKILSSCYRRCRR